MYIPQHFAETNTEHLHALVRAHPLATVITMSNLGPNANHIPMVLKETPAPLGTLKGHVARANPILNDLQENREILVIFHGPQAYISPSWYATKNETAKVVPTWNFAAVHAYGIPRIHEEPSWLLSFLQKLTNQQESAFSKPWAVEDAPHDYVEKLLGSIVGLEVVITRLLGKWKISQNQPEANRIGVQEGLKNAGGKNSQSMAEFMASRWT